MSASPEASWFLARETPLDSYLELGVAIQPLAEVAARIRNSSLRSTCRCMYEDVGDGTGGGAECAGGAMLYTRAYLQRSGDSVIGSVPSGGKNRLITSTNIAESARAIRLISNISGDRAVGDINRRSCHPSLEELAELWISGPGM
ncbi:hypothetical protein Tco_1004167 [Tanacetum coccineum]|uniref:Uncharacterized protein n=1 Tax=Tanacetum coccineum TaxID=301880 RepID=A0ABQ5FC87_9ASTR